MAAPSPLASPELYQSVVGAAPPEGLLEAVSATIRRYCGWHICPERVETFTLDGSAGRVLLLPSAHIVDVLAITNDGIALDPADVEWSSIGVVRSPSRWSAKLRGVTVRAVHGWDAGDVADIAMQAVLIAARVAASPHGETMSSAGGVSSQMGAIGIALTPAEEAHLAPYCVAGR